MNMDTPTILAFASMFMLPAVGAFVIVGVVLFIATFRKRRTTARFVERPLLTQHEQIFHGKLSAACDRLGIHACLPQVAMAAIVDVSPEVDRSNTWSVRNLFSQKIIDFVLVDHAMTVLAIVELDDRTHDVDKDARRDAITREAGYVTVRFRNARHLNVDDIVRELSRKVPFPSSTPHRS